MTWHEDIFPFSDAQPDISVDELRWEQYGKKTFLEMIGGEKNLPSWEDRIPARGIGDPFNYQLISGKIRARLMRAIELTNPLCNRDFLSFWEDEDPGLREQFASRLCFSSYDRLEGCEFVTLEVSNADVLEEGPGWRNFVIGENGKKVVERILSNGDRLVSVPGLADADQLVLRNLIDKIRTAFTSDRLALNEHYILGT